MLGQLSLGLVRMLSPERAGDSAREMVAAIRALANQRRPSEVRIPGLLDGTNAILSRTFEDVEESQIGHANLIA